MADKEIPGVPRRRFVRDAATAAAVTCLSPGLLTGCRAAPAGTTPAVAGADAMEQALEMLAGLAPLSNHGPMAAEALVALGRPDKVVAWAEGYRKRFGSAFPAPRGRVTRQNFREALGDGDRVADWVGFFDRELAEAPWPRVLERWTAVLAPGSCAAAAHGVIRTGHAARSLSVQETELRRRELAQGLGYWAAYYQLLPEVQACGSERLAPAQAIGRVPLLPAERRGYGGSIMATLRSLDGFPPFATAAALVEPGADAASFLSEVTETFAGVYLRDVSPRNAIALVHCVTGTTALRSLIPYLSPETARSALRYGWQAAAALYSAFGTGSADLPRAAEEVRRDDLIDRAVAAGDEHAIKFTEACLREHALNPKLVYLRAARDAVERLRN